MTVFALTPTGGRPEALRLLARYIDEQTWRGPLTWLICDDVDPPSQRPTPLRDGITVEIIRPNWRWESASTQARSMAALLDRVPEGASVIVAEDDDVYLPEHIETMLAALETAELVGQRVSLYYNVATRRYREMPGSNHASLGATALRGSALGLLRRICANGRDYIDVALWRQFTGPKALLETRTAIGIKGLPGRAGIGVGHRKAFGAPDAGGHVLREWIGDDRARLYRGSA